MRASRRTAAASSWAEILRSICECVSGTASCCWFHVPQVTARWSRYSSASSCAAYSRPALQDHDSILALINRRDAAGILGIGDEASAVRFRAHDVMASPEISARLSARMADVRSSDWTIENASYFRAIKLEKMMMSLILSLVIGVAAFNIVASLVMVVTDKTNDIAILRTLGMGPNGVVRVFFVQGAMIGWAGVFIGVLLGIVIALNVPTIVPFLENLLGFQVMPGDVYYVTRIPSELEWADVSVIAVSAFVLTSLATLYPARRAALVNPAVALRYE